MILNLVNSGVLSEKYLSRMESVLLTDFACKNPGPEDPALS